MEKDELKAIRETETKLFNARIGKNLKHLRESKKLTQDNMVDAMNKNNQSDYARLESGQRKLTLEDALKIADILDVPLQRIYNPNYEENNVSSTARDEREQYSPNKKSLLQLTLSVDGDSSTLEKQLTLLKKVNQILQQEQLDNS